MWFRRTKGKRPRAAARFTGALIASATAATALVGTASPAAADVIEPFTKRYDESLYGDFRTIGNTVMGCPTTPADMAARCAVAASGEGSDNNNTFDMQRVDTTGTTPGYGSSTGQVEIPPGAEVAYARLFWGGNDGTYKFGRNQLQRCDVSGADVEGSPGDPLDAVPEVGVAGGAASKVSPRNMVQDPTDTNGPHYYTGEADVTSLFSGVTGTGAPLPVSVGGVWAPNGKGCVAGWSMTVVYQYDAPNERYAPDRRNVYVYGGHVLQRSTSPATTVGVDGFYRTAGKPRASVTAYEGDWNTPGDRFLVDGQNVTEAHTGNTNNFFISEDDGSVDPRYRNNLSIDAKEFDVPEGAIPEGATDADLTFETKGDTYVPSALAFSVPVPDLEVTKTASPAKVHPGDTVTYTVKAKNVSRLPYPNAKLTDDLTDTLDDATYNKDAKATIGQVGYDEPRLSYTGDIPAGETATLTYSVTVDDPMRGDGKLRNDVDVLTPRSNCDEDSTDPACGATPEVDPSAPPVPPLTVESSPQDGEIPPCTSTTNTVRITNQSKDPRRDASFEWPVRKGDKPVASSGEIVREGSTYVWRGDVAARSTVTVTQEVKASCTAGEKVVIPVTSRVEKTNCPSAAERPARGTGPCVSVILAEREQHRPPPASESPDPGHHDGGPKPGHDGGPKPGHDGGGLANTGSSDGTLLYGGLALALGALGVLMLALSRRRR
ncbi:hypothetical protein DSC45_22425 [Streptomyces sp. YIM 130001]|uniref:DUF7927 domain-containing protein n=1 Tax=Streptomyces sp. YIM 130001 TaxID=2259644 RepID=UPI000E65B116|nr:DUF11 domain-containing protein [Streptomyces sp. YIM 130001]RII13712.1 hypothetical protein DSC45_22425 [Streptomyces sp. YIM 130001]